MRNSILVALILCAASFGTAFGTDVAGLPPINTVPVNIMGVGARAMGMGGAFIAIADDATAASWNPAGLAQITRPEASFVYNFLRRTNQWTFNDTTIGYKSIDDTEHIDSNAISFFSGTYNVNVKNRNLVVQFSYNNALNPADFSNNSTYQFYTNPVPETDVWTWNSGMDGGIRIYSFSLSQEILINRLYVGASVNYLRSDFSNTTTVNKVVTPTPIVDPENTNRDYQNSFKFSGVYVDIGVLFKLTRSLSLGAVYHSSFDASIDMQNWMSEWHPSASTQTPTPLTTKGTITWPGGFGLGVSYRPIQDLTLAFDYSLSFWSKCKISIDPTDNPSSSYTSKTYLFFPSFWSTTTESKELQNDIDSFRLGAEYILLKRPFLLPVRVGYFREGQLNNAANVFLEDPSSIPKTWGNGFTAGAGFSPIRHVNLDFAYVFTDIKDHAAGTTQDNLYTSDRASRIHRFIVSVIFRF